MSVSHILSAKGRDVVTAKSDDTVQNIAQMLAKNKIGAVVIVNDSGKIEGIVSERDIVRVISVDGASALTKKVGAMMTSHVKTCSANDSEVELMAMMTTNRIRHLPVVTNGKLMGMISIGDVVKYRIEAIEHEAEDLKSYIATAG